MKNCGHWNVKKHKDIKGGDKYVTLYISLMFDILDKMKITSSESIGKLEKWGNGFITLLGFKAKVRPQKYKKARNVNRNFSKKDLSKIIKEFAKFEILSYDKKRPKHEPTGSYFYLARQLAKCMIRADPLNWHNYGGYTEMTAPSLNVYFTYEDKSKRSIFNQTLPHNFSTDESE